VRVRWTRLALADFISAREHLDAENPDAADQLIGNVSDALKRLRNHPRLGRIVPERRSLGYRETVLPPYRLVYAVVGAEIHVLRLWHSRRDPAGI
jgi:addiction module RelE/StbE family toxin